MAFLTQYNLSQLSNKVEANTEISLEMFIQHIYNDEDIYYILNKRELEYLFVYKMLIDNEEKFIIEYYKEVPKKEDTKRLVFSKGGKMKYHLSLDCKLLTKDYLDFNIPEDIRVIGDDAIQEYRDWFRQNSFAERFKRGEIDKNYLIRAFNLKYPRKYDIKPIEDDSNLLVLEAKNSNFEELEQEFDLEKFKKDLLELKLQWRNSFQCPVSRKFAKFKHLLKASDDEIVARMNQIFTEGFVANYGLENLKQKFKQSKDITYEIIKLLLEYIRWTFKLSNKRFDKITLESLELECCYLCKEEIDKVL